MKNKMNPIKEFLAEKGYSPTIKTFKVPSRSEKGKFHTVELLQNGKLICDCLAGSFKHNCYHKNIVLQQLKGMIKIKVKSLWNGKIGIRDKYVRQAQKEYKDLCISFENRQMIIPFGEIDKMVVGKSENPVKDKFNNQLHYLIYFFWKASDKQKTLI